MHHNFCPYGGAKADFDSHSKWSFSSLHVYPSVYGPKCYGILQDLPAAGFTEHYTNNTCILSDAGQPVLSIHGTDGKSPAEFALSVLLANNTIYVPNGDAAGPTGFANYSAFIAAGYDNGTVIKADMPSADLILQWARQLLF